jgi:hypothetical protein
MNRSTGQALWSLMARSRCDGMNISIWKDDPLGESALRYPAPESSSECTAALLFIHVIDVSERSERAPAQTTQPFPAEVRPGPRTPPRTAPARARGGRTTRPAGAAVASPGRHRRGTPG